MNKVLLIESRYNSFYGAQKSMVKLIKTLEGRFNCTVLTTAEGTLKNELTRRNIEVEIIKLGKKANVFGGKFFSYSFLNKMVVAFNIIFYNFKLIPYILRNNFDVIYVNDIRASFYVFLASGVLRKKLICYIRGELTDDILTNIGLRIPDRVITIAHGVLRQLPRHLIQKYEDKFVNIYTGFNFEEINILQKEKAKQQLGIDINKLNIGFVGSLHPRKGLDLLIQALDTLSTTNDLNLTIIGGKSEGYEAYWESIRETLDQSKIDYNYLGYQNNMNIIYNSLDILVLPSRSEGLPRTVIEGMIYKLPVIATDVGGTKEIIDNDDKGILINKDSVKELSQAIEKLMSSKTLRANMGEVASKHVREKFNDEKYKHDIHKVFGEAVNSKRE